MSLSAIIRAMVLTGAPGESILAVVEAWEETQADSLAARRESDARRQREKRERDANNVMSRDVTVTVDGAVTEPSLSRPLPPQTPPTPTQSHPDINTRAKPNGFARFWEAYPNKSGKSAAEKSYARAFAKIGGHDPPAVLLAGVERAKASREWSEGYIPHPTTWLNQGRWEDEPAEIIPITGPRHERSHHDPRYQARQDNLARAFAGADSAARRQREP